MKKSNQNRVREDSRLTYGVVSYKSKREKNSYKSLLNWDEEELDLLEDEEEGGEW